MRAPDRCKSLPRTLAREGWAFCCLLRIGPEASSELSGTLIRCWAVGLDVVTGCVRQIALQTVEDVAVGIRADVLAAMVSASELSTDLAGFPGIVLL